MSYTFNNQVDYVSRALDSASRLRVSEPLTLFEHNNQLGTSVFKWDKLTAGTGTVTDNPNNSSTALTTGGTAANAQAVRASRNYIRYQVGKSLFLGMSFLFGAGVTGCSKRVGFYDVNNGIFLEQNGSTINIVVRSSGTGSPVDVATASTSWNVDKLDGTGPSGITFNPLGSNDFRVDFFGAFGMRFYMYFAGKFWLIHMIENANITSPTAPGSGTVNLPIREEIINLSSVSGTSTLTVYNANVMSEGATEIASTFNFSAGSGTATKAVTTRRPIFSIQPKTLSINGTTRNFGSINPIEISVYCDAATYFELVSSPATITGSSFASVNALSITNLDTSATAITGGIVVAAGYVGVPSGGASNAATTLTIFQQFPLVYSSLSNTQDVLTLMATSFTGTANCAGSLTWAEYY